MYIPQNRQGRGVIPAWVNLRVALSAGNSSYKTAHANSLVGMTGRPESVASYPLPPSGVSPAQAISANSQIRDPLYAVRTVA